MLHICISCTPTLFSCGYSPNVSLLCGFLKLFTEPLQRTSILILYLQNKTGSLLISLSIKMRLCQLKEEVCVFCTPRQIVCLLLHD